MNEIFLPLEANRGWLVRKSSEGLTFTYRRLLPDGKYVYGDSIRIPNQLVRKLLDESMMVRRLLE